MKKIIEVDSVFGKIKSFEKDLITDQIIKFGNYSRPEFAFASSIILNNFNLFDLGAHIGTFTLTALKKLNKDSQILSVEGNLESYKLLCENTKNYPNVCNLNKFVGYNEIGSYEYKQQNENNTGGGSLEKNINKKIETLSIDNLVENYFKPDYIKIDIEGFEGKVIDNSNYLKCYKPILYIEIKDNSLKKHGSSAKKLLGMLADYGYVFFRNIGQKNAEHDLFISCHIQNIEQLSIPILFDLLCVNKETKIFDYLIKSSVKITG